MKRIRPRFGIIRAYMFVLVLALFAFAGRAGAQAWPTWTADCTNNAVPQSIVGNVTWTPALCQEFNELLGLMDNSKVAWSYDTGGGGFGNSELEIYCPPPGYVGGVPVGCPNSFLTTTNTEYIDGSGHLVIQAVNNGVNNTGTWYSARPKTELIQNFKYGRIEARIQLPDTTNQGLWPAFWSMGTSLDTGVPWPTCGEADIMENWPPAVDSGAGTTGNNSTIHTTVTAGPGKGMRYTFPMGESTLAFHAYGVIWSTNMMQYYVDDPTKPFFIVTPSDLSPSDTWPFNAQIFLLMNVAVGGTLGGTPSISTPNPGKMLVDYVRQYTPSAVSAPNFGTPPGITVTAGATTGNTSTISPTPPPGTPPGATWYSYINCTTNAPDSSCSISTNDPLNHAVFNLTADGTIIVTFTSTARSWLPYRLDPRRWSPPMQIALPGLLFFALLLLLRRTGTARGFRYGAALGSLVLIGTILASCNANGTGGGQGGGGGGTTAGAYTITVNAFTESNTTGTADATGTVNVTVN